MPSIVPKVYASANLERLLEYFYAALAQSGLDSLGEERLHELVDYFHSFPLAEEDWKPFAFWDDYCYTRNLVDDGNGHFNLILLCWLPGQISSIHDHAGSHCIMRVLQGELVETLYESREDLLGPTRETRLPCDQTTYIHGIDTTILRDLFGR